MTKHECELMFVLIIVIESEERDQRFATLTR